MSAQIDVSELVREDRIHRKIYTEPEIFEAEMKQVFGNTWVFLGHESEIAERGDYKTTHIGTQPVIMTRDEDGQIHVLMNRCRHRGATICQEQKGNASYFRCSYHGWTYNNQGDLTGATYPDAYGERFDRSQHGLAKAARVASYRGLIFASLSAEVEELEEHLAGAKRYLDLFIDLSPEGEIEARIGVHKYGYDGNWKFQMENGVDGYHPNFVHKSFFDIQEKKLNQKLTGLFSNKSEGESRDLGNGHSILDMAPAMKSFAKDRTDVLKGSFPPSYLKRLEERWGPERAAEILSASNVNLAVFPNLLIIGVQLRIILPVSVSRTEVYLHPTTLKGVPDEVNVGRKRAHEAFYGPAGAGAPDDVEMFNRVTEGLKVEGVEWFDLSRGLHRERVENGERVGHITDEIPQRAFYRQWKQLMLTSRIESVNAVAGF